MVIEQQISARRERAHGSIVRIVTRPDGNLEIIAPTDDLLELDHGGDSPHQHDGANVAGIHAG